MLLPLAKVFRDISEKLTDSLATRRITTHSTGARVSLALIVNLSVLALRARPVNSGVMPLLLAIIEI